MAAPTDYYVDPGSGSNGNAGTSDAAAWATVDYALKNITPNTTSGDRINVKAGTDDVLTAALDPLTDYGLPIHQANLTIQGYTSTAGDGGVGGISGGGTYAVVNDNTLNYTNFIDMHLHSCGSANILTLDNSCNLIRCEIDTTTGQGVDADSTTKIIQCHFHGIDGHCINGAYHSLIYGCYLAGADGSDAISVSYSTAIIRNIITVSGNGDGVYGSGANTEIIGNSVLAAGSSGRGLAMSVNGAASSVIANNLVEGFSGTGGVGISTSSNIRDAVLASNNAVYNCSTAYSLGDVLDSADNETPGASPFAKSGANTYANRYSYFAPVDTGNVIDGALQ